MNIAVQRAALATRRLVPVQTTAARDGIALALRGVTKRFGGVQAITDVDMRVERGEIHAVIGPNGAGKSTLLNLISGLYAPDAGTIDVGGATRPRARDLARLGVARTFQNLALFEGLSVAQNVAMGRRARLRASIVEMGLAPLAVRAIFEALARLNREDGLSILLAEQNHTLARRYAHRALGLAGGRSTSADLATREQVDSLYFGTRAQEAASARAH